MSDNWESSDARGSNKHSDAPNGGFNAGGWGGDDDFSKSRTFTRGRGGRGRQESGGGRDRGDMSWGGDRPPGRGMGSRGRGGWDRNSDDRRGGRQENTWSNDRSDSNWGSDDRQSRGSRGDWAPRGRGNGNRSRGDEGDSVTMDVPSSMVGKIIGRGGSKISEMQDESGARISVTKEVHDDSTIVKLIGSPESIEKAKALIEELISGRRPGDGHSEGYANRD